MSITKVKRVIASTMAAGVLALGLVATGAGAANAAPSNCSKGWPSDGVARASCSSGTGQFRIGIPCKSIQTLGYGFTRYSSWVNHNQVAEVSCGFGAWLWADIPGGPQIILETRN